MGCLPPFSTGAGFFHPQYGDKEWVIYVNFGFSYPRLIGDYRKIHEWEILS
jgi:hypothetical protein